MKDEEEKKEAVEKKTTSKEELPVMKWDVTNWGQSRWPENGG